MHASWGYKEHNGPSTWKSVAEHAAGQHQSPVVIERASVKFDPHLKEKPLSTSYQLDSVKALQNNGHTATISVEGNDSHLSGGPLDVEYTLKQFHFHWGSKTGHGSEHVLDDKSYSAELHFVHWNSSKHATFEEAVKAEDGLAVLTVFLEVGEENHALKVITDLLPEVRHSGDKVSLPDGFNPASLLPGNTTHFWTYHGSLTTPPCLESVQFIIYEEPVQLSEQQLDAFRSLNICPRDHCPTGNHDDTAECCRLVDNFRPPMPLNDRVISASFEHNL